MALNVLLGSLSDSFISHPSFSYVTIYVCFCFSVLQGENLIVAVDDDGCFTSKITDFSGRYVKDADKDIIQAVKVFAWTLIVLQ